MLRPVTFRKFPHWAVEVQKEQDFNLKYLSFILLSRLVFGLHLAGVKLINHTACSKQSPFVCPYTSKSQHHCLFRLELILVPGSQEEPFKRPVINGLITSLRCAF